MALILCSGKGESLAVCDFPSYNHPTYNYYPYGSIYLSLAFSQTLILSNVPAIWQVTVVIYWSVELCADNGPPAATEDKVPSSTASVDGDKPPAASSSTTEAAAEADEDSNTKNTAEGDTTSSDAPAVAAASDQQPQIISVPELPDATANAFTQLVLFK